MPRFIVSDVQMAKAGWPMLALMCVCHAISALWDCVPVLIGRGRYRELRDLQYIVDDATRILNSYYRLKNSYEPDDEVENLDNDDEPDAKIRAPFTPEQVLALQAWQHGGGFHPFTCADRDDHPIVDGDKGILIPTVNGWICPFCDYRQNWAHAFMCKPATNDNPATHQITDTASMTDTNVTVSPASQESDALAKANAEIARLKGIFEWIETQAKESRTGISFDWIPSVEGEPSGWRFMRHHFIGEPRKSLVDAIEAARDSIDGIDRPR